MPENFLLTDNDLNKIFQNLVISILGFDEQAATWKAWKNGDRQEAQPFNPYYFVRLSWPEVGAPAWKISEDVCFLKCTESDDEINKQRDKTRLNVDDITSSEKVDYTRVITVNFLLYGPNSYKNSQLIKNELFKLSNRYILTQNQLFMVPDDKAPVRIKELFQGQWWHRTEFNITYNNHVTIYDEVNNITSAKIVVKSETSETTVNVVQN